MRRGHRLPSGVGQRWHALLLEVRSRAISRSSTTRLSDSVFASSTTTSGRRAAVAYQIGLVLDAAERFVEPEADLEPIGAMARDATFAATHGKVDHN